MDFYRTALKKLKTLKADPVELLRQAEEVYQLSMIEGIITDKVAGKETVTLVERVPGVAVQALNTKLAILKYIQERVDADEVMDTQPLEVNIKVAHG